jgi:hypothetical protein
MKQVRDGAPDKWSRSGWGQKMFLAWLGAFGFFCAIAQGLAQETHQITFDGVPFQPPGSASFVQQYYEADMWFRPLGVVGPGNGFVRVGAQPVPGRPDNGTSYLQAALGNSLVFSFLDGSVFNLVSVDLAEYSIVVPNAVTVPFVGYRFDGSVVNASFTTDGIIDGTGPIADFETFHFGPDFSGLTRVEIPTYGWSLDNVAVSVPEPAVGTLLLFGGLLVLGIRYSGCRR